MIEILIVLYRPDIGQLEAVLESARLAREQGLPIRARVWHNDEFPTPETAVAALYRAMNDRGFEVDIFGGAGNLGFGGGINRLLAYVDAAYVLILNQDAVPEPGALQYVWDVARSDPPEVAAWEMRQIPYEHPKAYDPVTLDVPWVSGAAVLLRAGPLEELGGFEPRIFMYGEDVDLSWRLRCRGYRLRYLPRAAVVHPTYSTPNEVKPLQVLGGIYANLCLRARYSGRRQILQGLSMAVGELLVPEAFPGRRKGILKAIFKFFGNYNYFRNSQFAATNFEPCFAGWGYEERREGAFHEFLPQARQALDTPLVSILIRTHRRPGFLRQALTAVANQTYRHIEAVVVEDDSDEGEIVCKEFQSQLTVRYYRIHPGLGRSIAGNRALAEARGEWFCFLDDDDQLFADHIEVLLQAARERGVLGAYGLSWRTHTRVIHDSTPEYEEVHKDIFPDEAFSRVVMWHHNYLPIQSVVFHQSLYERYGGFAPDMDQLEDWNLWTRYTISEDFIQVRKVTSKYRVPIDRQISAERQAKLDDAYRGAVARQEEMNFQANPAMVRKLAEDYARSNAFLHIGRDQIRDHMGRWPWFAKLMSFRVVLWRRWRSR